MSSFVNALINLNLFLLGASNELPNGTALGGPCPDAGCHVPGQSLLQRTTFNATKTKTNEADERSLITSRRKTGSTCDFGCQFGACDSDGDCSRCNSGYAVDAKREKCKPCTGHCTNCAYRRRETWCENCRSGYALYGGRCSPCASHCQECYQPGQCTKCNAGYALTPTRACGKCADNCQACTSPGTCDTCKAGYVLNTNTRMCDKCADFCHACATKDTCSTCKGGYFPAEQDPVPPNKVWCGRCAANCKTCRYLGTCDTCNAGYVVNTATKTCDRCADNCVNCDISKAGKCDICKTGYVVNTNTSLCDPCASNCHTCATRDTCSKCLTGYVLADLRDGAPPSGIYCDKCADNCVNCDESKAGKCDECESHKGASSVYVLTDDRLCKETSSSSTSFR